MHHVLRGRPAAAAAVAAFCLTSASLVASAGAARADDACGALPDRAYISDVTDAGYEATYLSGDTDYDGAHYQLQCTRGGQPVYEGTLWQNGEYQNLLRVVAEGGDAVPGGLPTEDLQTVDQSGEPDPSGDVAPLEGDVVADSVYLGPCTNGSQKGSAFQSKFIVAPRRVRS